MCTSASIPSARPQDPIPPPLPALSLSPGLGSHRSPQKPVYPTPPAPQPSICSPPSLAQIVPLAACQELELSGCTLAFWPWLCWVPCRRAMSMRPRSRLPKAGALVSRTPSSLCPTVGVHTERDVAAARELTGGAEQPGGAAEEGGCRQGDPRPGEQGEAGGAQL